MKGENVMSKETIDRLIKQAKNYSDDELKKFIDETGWEEWMDNFCSSDLPSDIDFARIDGVLAGIFMTAHAK